jgi:hypothetical protein
MLLLQVNGSRPGYWPTLIAALRGRGRRGDESYCDGYEFGLDHLDVLATSLGRPSRMVPSNPMHTNSPNWSRVGANHAVFYTLWNTPRLRCQEEGWLRLKCCSG